MGGDSVNGDFRAKVDALYHRLLVKVAKDALRGPVQLTDDYVEPLLQETLDFTDPDAEALVRVLRSKLIRDLESKEETVFSDGAWLSVDPEVCTCSPDEGGPCHDACAVDAIVMDENGHRRIDPKKCVDCGLCVNACHSGAISAKSECVKLVDLFRQRRQGSPVYAELAPAFIGQLGDEISVNQFKTGLLRLGFTDVWEVAMAADIVTLQEADEYVERMKAGEEFMITSCCCPAFVRLVEKHKPNIARLVSHSVSPMVAMGRLLKAREPEAKVVFIGPCLAKRAESKRPEVSDAVDLVLTFKEIMQLIEAAEIDWEECKIEAAGELADASHDGRIYAHTGGVSQAIARAIKEREPNMEIVTAKGNGLKQCMELLQKAESGEIDANFMEGMGCPGGCVGGPGTLVPVEIAADRVAAYADKAQFDAASSNDRARDMLGRFVKEVHLSSHKEPVPVS